MHDNTAYSATLSNEGDFDNVSKERAIREPKCSPPKTNNIPWSIRGISYPIINASEETVTRREFPKDRFRPQKAPPLFYLPSHYEAIGVKLMANNFTSPVLGCINNNATDDLSNMEDGTVFVKGYALYVKLNNSTAKPITNFVVQIRCIIIKRSFRDRENVFYEVSVKNISEEKILEISKERITNLKREIEKNAPSFYVDTTSVSKAPEYFKRYISMLIAKSNGQIGTHVIYTSAGWNVTQKGVLHYYSGCDPDCEDSRSLVDLAQISPMLINKADSFAFEVLNWGELRVMLPILLHSLSGFLYRLFKDAGRPIQYILNLCGPTGIGKTMLMRLLFRPFDPARQMPNFTGTQKGIELFCEQNHDSMAIVDDLSSMTDTKGKSLLESLIRQYCDGNGRMYSTNGGKDLFIADTSFGLCISSETPLEGFRQSSQVRILTLEMTPDSLIDLGDIKKELLTVHIEGQDSANPLDVFFTKFILWYLEPNYNDIVRFIADYEPPPLQVPTKFKRFYEAYRNLAATACLLLQYFITNRILPGEKAESVFIEWCNILQELIQENEFLGQGSDPAEIFIDTLKQGIAQGIIPIASSKKEYEVNCRGYMGFWRNNEELVLEPTEIFSWVVVRIESSRIQFQTTPQELWRKLQNREISKGYSEKNRKSPRPLYPTSINGKKANMLVLYGDKLA